MGSAVVIEETEALSSESKKVEISPSTLCPVSSETIKESQCFGCGGVLPTLDALGLFLLGVDFQVFLVVLLYSRLYEPMADMLLSCSRLSFHCCMF